MSPASAILAVLTADPMSTEDLYERVGYPTLVRVGLVPYHAFRDELVKLSAAGLAVSATGDDGGTTWRLGVPSDLSADAPPGPSVP